MPKPIDPEMKARLIKYGDNAALMKELKKENDKIRDDFLLGGYSTVDPTSDFKGTVNIPCDEFKVKLEYKIYESVKYSDAKALVKANGWNEEELFGIEWKIQEGKRKEFTPEQKALIGEITIAKQGSTGMEIIKNKEKK